MILGIDGFLIAHVKHHDNADNLSATFTCTNLITYCIVVTSMHHGYASI